MNTNRSRKKKIRLNSKDLSDASYGSNIRTPNGKKAMNMQFVSRNMVDMSMA